ncbi:MAG: YaiO family outer membrane beta-barrel protein [Bacteroidetes bacterium]|nr:MAG: YaiO family outer membrane beta-barrel protein [Bacteroidota bacterium]
MMRFYSRLIVLITILILFNNKINAQLPWGVKRITADEYFMMVTQKIKEKDYKSAIKLSYEGLNKMPDYMDLHFSQGQAFMLNGQYDSARIKLKYVMTEAPRYRDAYILATNLEMQLNYKEEALCVINDGLYYFPYEREFMTKKLEVLDFIGDYRGAEKYAERIINIHFNDSIALRYFLGYKSECALRYIKAGNYYKAAECYEAMAGLDPGNKEAIDGMFNIQIKKGNSQASLDLINAELIKNPKSYEYLTKKAGLLMDNYRFAEAQQVTGLLVSYYPGDGRAQILHYDAQMAGGRFYMSQDPYLVFQGVLEKKPKDKEALNYVINLATARGLHQDALAWENRALKELPNDREILEKKVGTCETLKRYGEAAATSERLVRMSPSNQVYRQQTVEYYLLSGRQNMKEQEYDSALANFDKALYYNPNNYLAISYAADILAQQKKYDEALDMIDKGLNDNPDDENLMFKRTIVLEQAGLLEEASKQADALYQAKPNNKRYENLAVDVKTAYGKSLMSIEDYDGAREVYREILYIQPNNIDALNGMINLESGTQRYDSALYYANRALEPDPNNRDLLLKKSSVYESQKKYTEAYSITYDLMKRYPYNGKIKQAYIIQVLASGAEFNKREKYDSALYEFNKVLAISPRDSNALNYAANIYLEKNQDDSALALTNKALKYYPGSEQFTFKRAIILEKMKRYPEASLAADSVVAINPTIRNVDFADALKAKALKNSLGFMFLYSMFDSASNLTRANIATLQYIRYFKRGSIGGRLNMAGRTTGTGVQGDFDINYIHSPKYTSYGNIGISNNVVFPSLKLGYSLFYNYKKTYTHEVGLRYLRFDLLDVGSTSLLVASTRYFGDFWATLKYYGTVQTGNTDIFHSGQLSLRQYLTADYEYVTASAGVGSTPDEFSRNFQLTENLGITTYNFGMGYTRLFRYRNTFSITGTWYNQKLNSGFFRNQYDLFFMFLRRF